MIHRAGIAFVCMVGMGDWGQTRGLVERMGPESELNAVARWCLESFGTAGLFWMKSFSLALFSITVLLAGQRNRPLANRALVVGIIISLFLAAWWGFAIGAGSGGQTAGLIADKRMLSGGIDIPLSIAFASFLILVGRGPAM